MNRYSLIYAALTLAVVLGVMHFIAETFYFYWTVWWFDNAMHLLAGLAGGFFVVWFLFDLKIRSGHFPTASRSIIGAVLWIMIIGLTWEIFEYENNITHSTEGYLLDTTQDLFFDVLGALVAGFIGTRRRTLGIGD